MIYEQSNLDMADSIIAAYADGEEIASFDEKLIEVNRVKNTFN